jgi:type IV secretory pathway component VirB8
MLIWCYVAAREKYDHEMALTRQTFFSHSACRDRFRCVSH